MPNSLLSQFRQQFPEDDRSDPDLTLAIGDLIAPETRQKFPDFEAQYKELELERRIRQAPSLTQELGTGFRGATAGLASTALGGAGMALRGIERLPFNIAAAMPPGIGLVRAVAEAPVPLSRVAAEKAKEQIDIQAQHPSTIHSVEEAIKSGEYAQYLAGATGQALPSLIEAGLTVIGGAAMGSAAGPVGTGGGLLTGVFARQAVKRLLRSQIDDALKAELGQLAKGELRRELSVGAQRALGEEAKNVAKQYGANVATGLNSYLLSAGEIYNNLTLDPQNPIDPDKAFNIALVGGFVSAIPDTFLPSYITGRILGGKTGKPITETVKRSFYPKLARFAGEVAKTTGIEGATEGFQEWVGIASERYANGQPIDAPLTDEDRSRILNAATIGGIAGFIAGPISGLAPEQRRQRNEAMDAAERAYFPSVSDERKQAIIEAELRKRTGQTTTQDVTEERTRTTEERNLATVLAVELDAKVAEKSAEDQLIADLSAPLTQDEVPITPTREGVNSKNLIAIAQHHLDGLRRQAFSESQKTLVEQIVRALVATTQDRLEGLAALFDLELDENAVEMPNRFGFVQIEQPRPPTPEITPAQLAARQAALGSVTPAPPQPAVEAETVTPVAEAVTPVTPITVAAARQPTNTDIDDAISRAENSLTGTGVDLADVAGDDAVTHGDFVEDIAILLRNEGFSVSQEDYQRISDALSDATSSQPVSQESATEVRVGVTEAKPSGAQAGVKEPWQKTVEEYVRERPDNSVGNPVAESTAKIEAKKRGADYYAEKVSDVQLNSAGKIVQDEKWQVKRRLSDAEKRKDHQEWVEAAVRAGKPVPLEVLADYPDLAPKPQPTAKPAAKEAVTEKPAVKSPLANLSEAEQQRAAALKEKLRDKFRPKLGIVDKGPFDPEIATTAAELGSLYVKGGIKTFSQFASAVKAELPEIWDNIKRYLRGVWNQLADVSGLEDATKAQAEEVIAALEEPVSPTGKKESEEQTEVGIIQRAREIALRIPDPLEAYRLIVELYAQQPRLGTRTVTSKTNQAYSTPAPLAYLAGMLADLHNGHRILEPTAGNGMLLITARPGAAIAANEIDPGRNERVKQFTGGQATRLDATSGEFQDMATQFEPDRVIANPPFGGQIEEGGKKKFAIVNAVTAKEETPSIDLAISLNSLETLTPDGKGVVILGSKTGSMAAHFGSNESRAKAYHRPEMLEFFARFNVVDWFTVDGSLYEKMGAGWPVDVLVIDGKKPTLTVEDGGIQRPWVEPPKVFTSWAELESKLDEAQQRSRRTTGEPAGGVSGVERPAVSPRGAAGGAPTTPRSPEPSGAKPATPETQRPVAPEPSVVKAGGPSVIPPAGAGLPGTGPEVGRAPRVAPKVSAGRAALVEGETRLNVPYESVSKNADPKLVVPSNLADAMRRAVLQLEADTGKSVDDFLASKMGWTKAQLYGRLNSAQIEAVSLFVHNSETRKTGLINSDQTGVGKGRTIASVIEYAKRIGKIPVFITQAKHLYTDMAGRDLPKVGNKTFTPFITDAQYVYEDGSGNEVIGEESSKERREIMREIGNAGSLPKGFDGIFTTYYQLQSDKPEGWKEEPKARFKRKKKLEARPDGPRLAMLRKLAPNAIFILDEAHMAAGQDSDVGLSLQSILMEADGVYYSSATFAKRPDNLTLYALGSALGLSGLSTEQLTDIFKTGGIPMQQALTTMLAEEGEFVRREQNMKDVTFKFPRVSGDRNAEVQAADTYTSFLRDLHDLADMVNAAAQGVVDDGNQVRPEEAEVNLTSINFGSRLFNLSNQYLFALRAEATASKAISALQNGQKPFIAVFNTMAGPISDLQARELPLNFGGLLRREMLKMLEVKIKDPLAPADPANGLKKGERLLILKPEDLPDGGAFFRRVEAQIEATDFGGMPISPIDAIKRRIQEAGYSIGEITAREGEVEETGGVVTVSKRQRKERNKILSEYNHGVLDALIVNGSGATGLSAHTDPIFRDQRQRHMIVAQAAPDINSFMQMLGRVMRFGQTSLPEFTVLTTNLAAERRFMTMLRGKLSSLNANTSAETESGITRGGLADDIFNFIGDEIVLEVVRANPDLASLARIELPDPDEEEGSSGYARYATGRFVMLPDADADRLWQDIGEIYESRIRALDEAGENPLKATVRDLRASTTAVSELETGTGTTAFDGPVVMERVEIQPPKQPFTYEEAVALSEQNADEMSSKVDEWVNQWREAAKARIDTMQAREMPQEQIDRTQAALNAAYESVLWAARLRGKVVGIDPAQQGIPLFYAVPIGIELRGREPGDFSSASKQVLILATNTVRRRISLPLSQAASVVEDVAPEDFDANSETTATRYVVTGNLLRGYSVASGLSQNVSRPSVTVYSTRDGGVRTGILMSPAFSPVSAKTQQPVATVEKFRDAIESNREMIAGVPHILTVTGRRLSVPSNQGQKAIWGDRAFNSLFDRSPIEKGGNFTGTVRRGSEEELFAFLSGKGVKMFLSGGKQMKFTPVAPTAEALPVSQLTTPTYSPSDLALREGETEEAHRERVRSAARTLGIDPSIQPDTAKLARLVIEKQESAKNQTNPPTSFPSLPNWTEVEGGPMVETDRSLDPVIAASNGSALGVLRHIAQNSQNPFYRLVAQKLADAGVNPRVERLPDADAYTKKYGQEVSALSGGVFNSEENLIVLTDWAGNQEKIFVHEMIHAASVQRIMGNPQFKAQLSALRSMAEKAYTGTYLYGLKNDFEFLAEALSDPYFQTFLQNTRVDGRSLWTRFVDFIRGLLGLSTLSANLLEETFRVAAPIFISGTMPIDAMAVQGRAARLHTTTASDPAQIETYNFGDGTMEYADAVEDSVEAAQFNTRNSLYLYNPAPPIHEQIDLSNRLNIDAAVNNHDVGLETKSVAAIKPESLAVRLATAKGIPLPKLLRQVLGLKDTEAVANAVLARATDRQGNPVPFNAAQQLDNFMQGGASRDRVLTRAFHNTQAALLRIGKKKADAQARIATNEERRGALLDTFNADLKNYTDADALTSQQQGNVRKMLTGLLKNFVQGMRRLGQIEQQLNELEGQKGEPIPRRYYTVFQELFTGNELRGTNLFDLLETIATDSRIDLTQGIRAVRVALRAANDPAYAKLIQDTETSKALLATVVAYGKANTKMMAMLELRRMKAGEERAKINNDMRELLKAGRDDLLKQIRRLPRLAVLEERARQAYREQLKRVLALQRQVERDTMTAELADAAMPVYVEGFAELVRQLQVSPQFVFRDGALFFHPPSHDASDEQVKAVERPLSLDSTGQPVEKAALNQYLDDAGLWLMNRDRQAAQGNRAALTPLYYAVKRQRDIIFQHRFYTAQKIKTDRKHIELYLLDAAKAIEALGFGPAREISRMLREFQTRLDGIWPSVLRDHVNRSEREERRVLGVLNRGRPKEPIDAQKYREHILFPVMQLMEQSRGLEESYAGNAAGLESALRNRAAAWLMKQDYVRTLVAGREQEFFRHLFEHVSVIESASAYAHSKVRERTPVRDPTMIMKEDAAVRRATRVGPKTFSRKYSQKVFGNMVSAMDLSGWVDFVQGVRKGIPGEEGVPASIAELYNSGQQDLLRAWYQRFFFDPIHGATIQDVFFKELANLPLQSVFDAPVLSDGVTRLEADPPLASEAYELSNGDPVKFFEFLYDAHDGESDKGQYVEEGLKRLALIYHQTHQDNALFQDEPNVEIVTLRGMVAPIMSDARIIDNFPGRWFDYHTYDHQDGYSVTKRIAAQDAFGYQSATLAYMFQSLRKEIARDLTNLANVEASILNADPLIGKKEMREESVRRIGSKTEFERLDNLRNQMGRKGNFLDSVERALIDFFRNQNDPIVTMRTGIRFAGFIAGRLVEAPGPAITQLAALADPIVTFGVSLPTIKFVARNIATVGRELVNGLGYAIGVQWLKASRREQEFLALNLTEPSVSRQFGDAFNQRYPDESRLARGMRFLSDAQSFALKWPGTTPTGNTIKPLAPFRTAVPMINKALTINMVEFVNEYLLKAKQFLDANESAYNDPEHAISPKDMGLGPWDRQTFERLRGYLSGWGLDFDAMAREAKRRLGKGETSLISNDDWLRLNSLSLHEISLEAGLVTTPFKVHGSGFMQLALPLLRWQFARAIQVFPSGRLDAEGQASARALLRMLAGVAFTGLTSGLILSLLVEEYNKRLLGKKQNLRPLLGGDSPEDTALALLERTARVGVFGSWGELVNTGINVGTGQGDNRAFSLDQRIVAANAIYSFLQAGNSLIHQGEFDYARVGRPMITALGGSGMLQYAQIVNQAAEVNLMGEGDYIKRLNVRNILRVAGRQLDMDVQPARAGYEAPTPLTPYITRMDFAVYQQNPSDFKRAYREAIEKADDLGRPDPVRSVQQAFSSRHPLRTIFRASVTEADYRRILQSLPDEEREDVQDAVKLFNRYGSSIGVSEFTGVERRSPAGTGLPRLSSYDVRRLGLQNLGASSIFR